MAMRGQQQSRANEILHIYQSLCAAGAPVTTGFLLFDIKFAQTQVEGLPVNK